MNNLVQKSKFIYYKEIYKPYSTLEKEHLSIRLTSKNIQEINNILDEYILMENHLLLIHY